MAIADGDKLHNFVHRLVGGGDSSLDVGPFRLHDDVVLRFDMLDTPLQGATAVETFFRRGLHPWIPRYVAKEQDNAMQQPNASDTDTTLYESAIDITSAHTPNDSSDIEGLYQITFKSTKPDVLRKCTAFRKFCRHHLSLHPEYRQHLQLPPDQPGTVHTVLQVRANPDATITNIRWILDVQHPHSAVWSPPSRLPRTSKGKIYDECIKLKSIALDAARLIPLAIQYEILVLCIQTIIAAEESLLAAETTASRSYPVNIAGFVTALWSFGNFAIILALLIVNRVWNGKAMSYESKKDTQAWLENLVGPLPASAATFITVSRGFASNARLCTQHAPKSCDAGSRVDGHNSDGPATTEVGESAVVPDETFFAKSSDNSLARVDLEACSPAANVASADNCTLSDQLTKSVRNFTPPVPVSHGMARSRTVSYGRGSFPIARLNRSGSSSSLDKSDEDAEPESTCAKILHGHQASLSAALRPSLLRQVSNMFEVASEALCEDLSTNDKQSRTYADAVKDSSSQCTPALSPSVSFGSPELSSYGADTPQELSRVHHDAFEPEVCKVLSEHGNEPKEGTLLG